MSYHTSFFFNIAERTVMEFTQYLPPDRTKIEGETFQFHCHAGVSCFLSCCRNVDMLLFPYDVILLKKHLNLHSTEFLRKYTHLCEGSHPFFPGLKLNMSDSEQHPCPFLGAEGCTVYIYRPSACRTYPLERGVEHPGHRQAVKIHYFMTHHPYCKGHFEERNYTINQWERDQVLHECNQYNDYWAELDAFFATNPWAGEGKAGPYQQLAFMVCYNIDEFRSYSERHNLLSHFKLNKDARRRILKDDGALLRFGFDWLEYILGGRKKI
jgi:Fe-S-cluster containining protein